MSKAKPSIKLNTSTEENTVEPVRIVFREDGYTLICTSDLVKESGIGWSLLNYCFSTKEKFFRLGIAEKLHRLYRTILPTIHTVELTPGHKSERLSEGYSDVPVDTPILPVVLIKTVSEDFKDPLQKQHTTTSSSFVRRMREKNTGHRTTACYCYLFGNVQISFCSETLFVFEQQRLPCAQGKGRTLPAKWGNPFKKLNHFFCQ